MARFEIRDLGDVKWFLSIRVIRDRLERKIWLSQEVYATNMATKFHLQELKGSPSTPLPYEPLGRNEDSADAKFTHFYQEKVGSIIYPSGTIRPDLAYLTGLLA